MPDIIVVGGGPAGITAALRARELGATVGLVERDRLGGICTNDGCVPTRVLAKAARLARDAEQYPDYGLSGDAPAVNLGELMARAQETVYRVHEKKQLLANLTQAEVTVWDGAGEVYFTGPHKLMLNGDQKVEADKFIICAGGHARRLSFPGSEHALTHSDIWRLEKVPPSVAIVGGAATGCQLASIFSAFGARVTILDVAPTILGIEDAEVSRAMTEAFQQRGIEIVGDIKGVGEIEPAKHGFKLHYDHPEGSRSLKVDAVIMAVGWMGNIEKLGLEAAGVENERGYIIVDDALQTTAAHIFAAGDITGRMMLVQTATQEGRVAAENAVLEVQNGFQHNLVPHGGFTDPEYGSVGLTESQANEVGDTITAVVPYADLDRAVIDGRTEGLCKIVASPADGKVLGAHVVGEQALEVVQMAAAGMAAGITVSQLAELELAYPTYTAIIGLAARKVVRRLDLSPLKPVWRALGPVKPRQAEWEMSVS
jgi:pyruvate/2-oxoglutarate dehydrogenase complex dihydrolipoamide dehydrogenase (E3) component